MGNSNDGQKTQVLFLALAAIWLFAMPVQSAAVEYLSFPEVTKFSKRHNCTIASFCPDNTCEEVETCTLDRIKLRQLFFLYLYEASEYAIVVPEWRKTEAASRQISQALKRNSRASCASKNTNRDKALCILKDEERKKHIRLYFVRDDEGSVSREPSEISANPVSQTSENRAVILSEASKSEPDAKSPRPFAAADYKSGDLKVSTKSINNGAAAIELIQVKRVSDNSKPSPHFCRAWIKVSNGKNVVFQNEFDDIEPLGGFYGFSLPSKQVPSPYLAVFKHGDYNGRMFLVRNDGKVFDLLGGDYFLTKDNKYLFSIFETDGSGLEVFDLRTGKSVFSTTESYDQLEWYERNGQYFFIQEYLSPILKTGTAFFFNFKTMRLEKRSVTENEINKSRKIERVSAARGSKSCEFSGSASN